MGHNFYGQAGAGRGYDVRTGLPIAYTPVRVVGMEEGDRVVGVSVGFEHMLAVTEGGALYAWGRGDRGQLGVGDKESYKSAVRVLGPRDVFLPPPPPSEEVAPRDGAATADGGGAAAAASPFDEEGAAAAAVASRRAPPHTRVVAAEAGVSQSACITADGRLWVWGKMQATRVKPGTGGAGAEAGAPEYGDGGGSGGSGGARHTQPTSSAGSREHGGGTVAAAVPVITNPGAGTLSTRAAAAAQLAAAQGPGPALVMGVMEDELNPRPVYFADELLDAGVGEDGRGGAVGVGTAGDAGCVAERVHADGPVEHDTLFQRGVIVGRGLGAPPTANCSSSGSGSGDGGGGPADLVAVAHGDTAAATYAAAAAPGDPPPPPPPRAQAALSPHYPTARRVVGLTSGHAHTSFLTDDGRLWLVGMRGRGVQFDDSGVDGRAAGGADGEGGAPSGRVPAATAPCLSPCAPVGARAAAASATPLGGLVAEPPLPGLAVQLRPWEVAPGPLAGHTVVRLRSSTHHSYAITQEGRVFRWGWRGVVLPVRELEPEAAAGDAVAAAPRLQVADIQFGHSHAMLLAVEAAAGQINEVSC